MNVIYYLLLPTEKNWFNLYIKIKAQVPGVRGLGSEVKIRILSDPMKPYERKLMHLLVVVHRTHYFISLSINSSSYILNFPISDQKKVYVVGPMNSNN